MSLPPQPNTVQTPKPARMQVIADNVPDSLRRLPRWLSWNWTWNPDKHGGKGGWDKPPLKTLTGYKTDSTAPASWTDFDTAYRAHERGDYDGVGIALGKISDTGLTLCGLDLDEVRDALTGDIAPWAIWDLRILNTYSEHSPSGTGVKAFALGTLPQGGRDNSRGVEMYDSGRYFTVTGHRIDGLPVEVMERAQALEEIYALAFAPEPSPAMDKRDVALSALAGLNKQRAVSYRDWISVGMALHSVDTALLDEWDRWSQSCPEKYQAGACVAKWATFHGNGITLGSLVYWAKADGWKFPASAAVGSTSPTLPHSANHSTRQTAQQIILAWFKEDYAPSFKRGATVIYSTTRGGIVKVSEATLAPPTPLIERLVHAVDCPKDDDDKGHGKRTAVPRLFATWAKSAWVDLIRELPEEEDVKVSSGAGREEFAAQIADVLHTQQVFGTHVKNGYETKQERRSLIDFAQLWGKKHWAQIRSLQLWCRADASGLQVALRRELFKQIGHGDLAKISATKLTRLFEAYGIGHGSVVLSRRVIVLEADFLAEHVGGARPDADSGAPVGADDPGPVSTPSANGRGVGPADQAEILRRTAEATAAHAAAGGAVPDGMKRWAEERVAEKL